MKRNVMRDGMIIGKLCFDTSKREDFFYGLELCLAKASRTAYKVDAHTVKGCDVLLVSVFWYRDAYLLEGFLRQAGIRPGGHGPVIIVGGMQATMTPRVFAPMADYVFIGDGDDHLGGILDDIERGEAPTNPYLYRHGQEHVPLPAVCKPTPFLYYKGGTKNTARMEIARGCRFKCPFCALSGLKPYQEVPWKDLYPLLDESYPTGVSCFAPDRSGHSEWDELSAYLTRTKRMDFGQDVRLERIDKVARNTATVGIEGVSHRLRKLVRKPWSNEYIITQIQTFVERFKAHVMLNAYFIADLPGETNDDYAELKTLLDAMSREEWARRLTVRPILNPLSPKPFTALAESVIHPYRDYASLWRRTIRNDEAGWTFRVVERVAVWGPIERIMDAVVTHGHERAYDVIKRLPQWMLVNTTFAKGFRNRVVKQFHSELKRFGLTDDVLRIEP